MICIGERSLRVSRAVARFAELGFRLSKSRSGAPGNRDVSTRPSDSLNMTIREMLRWLLTAGWLKISRGEGGIVSSIPALSRG